MIGALQMYARHLLGVAGIMLLASLAWYWRTSVAAVLGTVDPALFSAALLLGLTLAVVQGLCFAELMRKNGATATRTALVAAFLVSQPAKYVPGKIMTPIMQRISLGATAGTATTVAANIELAIVLTVQITGLGLAFTFLPRVWVATLCVAATALAVWGLLRTEGVAHIVARALHRPRWLEVAPAGAPLSSIYAAALSVASLALIVASSACVLTSSVAAGDNMPAALASVFLGVASSLAAFVVPAGLGIREAATAGAGTLIPGAPSPQILLAFALLFRCWQLAVDAGSALLGWTIIRLLSFRQRIR